MNLKPLTMTMSQQRHIFKMSHLEGTIMLCALMLDNSDSDITTESLRLLSGYSAPSVKRGLKSLVKNGYLKMEIRRDNGRYVGVHYTIINDLRRKEHA